MSRIPVLKWRQSTSPTGGVAIAEPGPCPPRSIIEQFSTTQGNIVRPCVSVLTENVRFAIPVKIAIARVDEGRVYIRAGTRPKPQPGISTLWPKCGWPR